MWGKDSILKWSLIYFGHYIWIRLAFWVILLILPVSSKTVNSNPGEIIQLIGAAFLTIIHFQKINMRALLNPEIIMISGLTTFYILLINILVFFMLLKPHQTINASNMQTILVASVIGLFINFLIIAVSLFVTPKIFKIKDPKEFMEPEPIINPSDALTQAKEAYIRRNYALAYELFRKAELGGALDETSKRFMKISKEKRQNA